MRWSICLRERRFRNFTHRIVQNIHRIIKTLNNTHSHRLPNKPPCLLDESKWKHIGRLEMILNLTIFQFSTTEIEALSLGLKFTTGIYKNITTVYIKHMDVTRVLELILETTSFKATAVRLLHPPSKNYPSKTRRYAGHCWRSQ